MQDIVITLLQKMFILTLHCANEYTHCIREIGSTYYRIYRNQEHNIEFLNKAEQYYRESFGEIERIISNGVDDNLSLLFEKRRNALHMNLGRVLIEKKDYDAAREYLFRSKAWFDSQPNRDGDQSSIYFSLGDYFLAINDAQAVEYLKIAMEKSNNILTRFSFSCMEKNRSLARAYEIIEDYINATETYKEMLEIARVILVSEHPIIKEVTDKINELTEKMVLKGIK